MKKGPGPPTPSGPTVAIIQARLGSSRLPLKMLLCLRGAPLIDWVIRRVAVSRLLDKIVVAMPDAPLDDVLAEHLRERLPAADPRLALFRGPENDVLERFRAAGAAFGAARVVRVCADNPLIWGGEIDNLINFFTACSARAPAGAPALYAYNHIPRGNSYPDGIGAEMTAFSTLEKIAALAVRPGHREHCLSYIWDRPRDFRIRTFDPPDPALRRPEIRLDVDSAEDFARLARLPLNPDMPPREVLAALDALDARDARDALDARDAAADA